jgi:nitroreductase
VLGSASDDRLSQLRAGEAMSAVLLQATQLGLATCPLSQPLEVFSARRVLQDQVLGGTLIPQLVLRIGFAPDAPPLPATPRRPIRDILRPEPS